MARDYFWLNEEQFSRLEALLPNYTRGLHRIGVRRVISGIIHVLKSGGCSSHPPRLSSATSSVALDL